jgi:O-antigen/teichoic acid export membrane protein
VWSLFRVGFPLGLMSLGDRLTFYSCDVVTGALFGATATAGFYGTRMPGFFAASVIWRLGDAVVPGVNQLYGAGETAAFRGAYDRVLGYGLGIAVWAGAAVCVFSGPLVGVWLGPELYIGSATACAAGLLVPLSTYKNLVTRFLIAEGRLGTYPAVVFAEGVASVVLGVACARTWGIAGMLWGMILAQGITLAFLVRRSGALFRAPALRVLLGVASWGLRASAVGVIACVAWVAARACGVVVPWPAGLAAVLALGALGFHRFGLTAADRTRVTAAARRLTARRTADEGRT